MQVNKATIGPIKAFAYLPATVNISRYSYL